VLCELARTDRHRFRILEPDSDQTKALRALTRAREDLVGARVALANQLRSELERFWPGPIGLFSDLDSPISLAFLARYPSPQDARGLGEKRLAGFLKAQRYNNRKTSAQLLQRLRAAPAGRCGEIETRTRRSIVLRLIATVQSIVAQIAELESEIAEALDAHPDGEIFRSFFHSRHSVICAATLLAEIGATVVSATPIAMRSPPTPATRRSPSNPGNARTPAFAGRATSACAPRWRPSRRAPSAGTPGPLTATARPARAGTATLARSALGGPRSSVHLL
jgi:transposase